MYKLTATTFQGLENVLASEIEKIGGNNVETGKRAVYFEGNKELLYKSNYLLQTALRILLPIKQFKVTGPDQLYEQTKSFNWDSYFTYKQTFLVDSVVFSKYFSHSHFVALKVKDAIVDFFREKYSIRPGIDKENPDVRVNIHINHDKCTLSFDSSGETLNRRGYRKEQPVAPINEVLAAGIIHLSGWDGECNFIDPMCGSGTFIAEAAIYSGKLAPGAFRKKYGFMAWKDFDSNLWEEIISKNNGEPQKTEADLIGYDIDRLVLNSSRKNTKLFPYQDKIRFSYCDFNELRPPTGKGMVIFNPPYDKRLKTDDLDDFFAMIGSRLKHFFAGKDVWIICPNVPSIKKIGLKPSHKITVFNGPIECKLLHFEVYEGTRKKK